MNYELWLIWKDNLTRLRYKIGVLKYDGKNYIFKYTNPELNDAQKVGFKYYPGFPDINKEYISEKLFSNIKTRLPNKKRPDYLEILNSYGLEKDSQEWEILETTKGRLITDNFEFVPAFNNRKIEFDIAGTNYSKDIKKICKDLQVNDSLGFECDTFNKYDKYAIKIFIEKNKKRYYLGYVPKYYSEYLNKLLKSNIEYSVMIKSLNLESKINDELFLVKVKIIFDDELI